jgi:hypothetical protein
LSNKEASECNSDEYGDLQILQRELMGKLNGPLRQFIKKNRVSLEDRVYSGFDTEFETVDAMKNELLCLTMATTRKVILKISKLNVDFEITNDGGGNSLSSKKPVVGTIIRIGLLLIRHFEGKRDVETNILLTDLRSCEVVECLDTKNDTLVEVKKELTPDLFAISYLDVSNDDRGLLTLPNLLAVSKDVTVGEYEGARLFISKVLAEYLPEEGGKTVRLREKRSFYLMCHYSPADLSFLADLQGYKRKLKLLGKSLITMKPISVPGCTHQINIRDTSILTPGLPGLGWISNLYKHPLLKKLDVPFGKIKKMSSFKVEDPNLFVQYATNDAVITLYHALRMERTNYEHTLKYEIPVTLSSVASRYLSRKIGGPRYDLPTSNGLFNVKDLPRLFSPKGIELSGGLTEWLGMYLATYKGGRNENFVYGLTKGKVVDIDLKAAYAVGLSMLQYPKYLEIQRIITCTGEELLTEYGDKLIKSFSSFKVSFKYPKETAFPNIPVRLGEGSIVFPLEGVGYCTGVELYFALTTLKCDVIVLDGWIIPFFNSKAEAKAKQEEAEERGFYAIITESLERGERGEKGQEPLEFNKIAPEFAKCYVRDNELKDHKSMRDIIK